MKSIILTALVATALYPPAFAADEHPHSQNHTRQTGSRLIRSRRFHNHAELLPETANFLKVSEHADRALTVEVSVDGSMWNFRFPADYKLVYLAQAMRLPPKEAVCALAVHAQRQSPAHLDRYLLRLIKNDYMSGKTVGALAVARFYRGLMRQAAEQTLQDRLLIARMNGIKGIIRHLKCAAAEKRMAD